VKDFLEHPGKGKLKLAAHVNTLVKHSRTHAVETDKKTIPGTKITKSRQNDMKHAKPLLKYHEKAECLPSIADMIPVKFI